MGKVNPQGFFLLYRVMDNG